MPFYAPGGTALVVERKRGKVSISPDPVVVDWIDARTGLGKPFKDRTHAFEQGIARMMEEEAVRKELGLRPLPTDDSLLSALVKFLKHQASNSEGKGASKTESHRRQ
jgi:hypothetical protein